MSVGGSIQEISIGGRIFAVAADADVSRKIGGFSAAFEANGNGSGRKILTREGWELGGLTVDVNDTRGDQEALQGYQDGTAPGRDADGFYAVSITYASQDVWSGRGTVLEGAEFASMATTAAIKLGGPGKLVKQ